MSSIKSSRCGNGACVEVMLDGDRVLVRDSKLGNDSPVIRYALRDWQRLIVERVKAGIDPTGLYEPYEIDAEVPAGGVALAWLAADPTTDVLAVLTFTRAEWDAFLAGVEDGDFDFEAVPRA